MGDEWTAAMLDGAFERAWVVCDAVLSERRGLACAHLPYHLQWAWDGTPLAGRRVLVRCYHGLGDTIQFIRFVPRLAELAASVVVEAQAPLLPLIGQTPGIAALYPLGAELPPWDVAIESMEIPHALRLTLADLPGPVPYLFAPTGRRTRSQRVPRVGLVWAGGDWRRERSVSAAFLLPLTRLPVDVVALQLGQARHEPAGARLVRSCIAAIPEDASITETAALLGSLDLVISIDTMVAHLAGALGRLVWTLLDADADWRWMRGRSDSPWYPTMRLFRQPRPGAWEPVMENVMAEMAAWAAAFRPERDLISVR